MAKFNLVAYEKLLTKGLHAKLEEKEVLLELKVALKQALATAQRNHDEWEKLAHGHKNRAKVAVGEAEEALEAIKQGGAKGEEQLKRIVSAKQTIAQTVEQIKQDAEDYARAFDGDKFRADLAASVFLVLQSFKTVPAYKNCKKDTELGKQVAKVAMEAAAERQKIISADLLLAAERQRIDEYAERAATFLATAQKLVSGENLDKSKFIDGVKSIKAELGHADNKDSLLGMYAQIEEKITRNDRTREGGDLPTMKVQLPSFMDEAEKRRKNLSGKLKTTLLELQSLKSLFGKKPFAEQVLPALEKTLVTLVNDSKMQEARINRSVRLMDEAIKRGG